MRFRYYERVTRNKAMKISIYIANHPMVLDYDIDDTESFLRHDVILKEGHSFHGLDSPRERRCGLFRTVADFKAAMPTKDD
jgi:hypothetical protein